MKNYVGVISSIGLMTAMLPVFAAPQICSGQASASLLHSIAANAEEAKHNATIYQWQRVNREVDRIVADAHRLPAAKGSDASVSSLLSAIQRLRSARLNRNVRQLTAAAQEVVEACKAIGPI